MPKNVMKMLKPSPNYGRNDFDLSHRVIHTANFGELIPTFCVETLPKDKIKIKVSDLVRAEPFVTSPFLRAKQHVDVWFVPFNMMWSRFNEFLMDKDEPASSAFKDRLFVPAVDTNSLSTALSYWADSSLPLICDIHGQKPCDSIERNLDLLGYAGTFLDINNRQSGAAVQFPTLKFNLWRLLAYNLIWYREYRQQYYDDGKYLLPSAIANLSNGASYLFNMDFLDCSTDQLADLVNSTYGMDILVAMLQPRYRCWKKDIFTGLMPSTQFGNVSLIDVSLPSNFYLRGNNNNMGSSTVTTDSLANQQAGSGALWNLASSSSTVFSSFDVLALRKSEAVQKWRENSLRAGNQIQDNFEAHFGVKPASHMDVHPKHVASFDAPLNIGDINSQASTGQAVNGFLGDVAGKGIMSFGGNDEFTFETNDYGLLMAMYSILPEAEYNANNLDRLNCLLEREDYFFPEYENLGLEPVDSSVISLNSSYNSAIGFAPRYFGYKQKHDRCVGEFMNFQGYTGQFRQWCSPKYDVDDAISNYNNTLPLSTLYVNPAIFGVNFNIADYKTLPQFLVDMYVDCEAIRQMSVSGMPSY